MDKVTSVKDKIGILIIDRVNGTLYGQRCPPRFDGVYIGIEQQAQLGFSVWLQRAAHGAESQCSTTR
jgi:hypothetical protein